MAYLSTENVRGGALLIQHKPNAYFQRKAEEEKISTDVSNFWESAVQYSLDAPEDVAFNREVEISKCLAEQLKTIQGKDWHLVTVDRGTSTEAIQSQVSALPFHYMDTFPFYQWTRLQDFPNIINCIENLDKKEFYKNMEKPSRLYHEDAQHGWEALRGLLSLSEADQKKLEVELTSLVSIALANNGRDYKSIVEKAVAKLTGGKTNFNQAEMEVIKTFIYWFSAILDNHQKAVNQSADSKGPLRSSLPKPEVLLVKRLKDAIVEGRLALSLARFKGVFTGDKKAGRLVFYAGLAAKLTKLNGAELKTAVKKAGKNIIYVLPFLKLASPEKAGEIMKSMGMSIRDQKMLESQLKSKKVQAFLKRFHQDWYWM